MAKQVINVYRGIQSGRLFFDESTLLMKQTTTGTELVDKRTGEQVLLDQKMSKSAICFKG